MSSKRKKTEESESQETFYISTEPSPLAPKSITETLISEKDKNTNTNDSDSENGDPNQNEISTNTLISASNYSETKYNSDSEESTPLGETQERKKSYKTKKDAKSSVKTTYGDETISRNRIKYSETAEKSLEQFLFGKSTYKQGVKRKLDSEEGSECSDSSEGELDTVKLSKENSKIYSASSNYKSDNEVSSSEDETEDSESESKDLPTWGSGDKHDKKHMPAWHDKDDLEVEVRDVAGTFTKAKGKHGGKDVSSENYAQSLRRKFKALKDIPKWADFELQKKNAEEEDSDDEFFRETTDMLDIGKKISLSKGFLEYRKLKDINEETHAEGTVIRAAEFHPTASVGLVAGLNGTTSLFQIDGKSNPKMQTINFENYPIKTAHFTADGKQFIVGSPHFSHFFMYDMIAGKNIRVPWKEDGKSTLSKFVVSPAGDIIAFQGRFGNIHIYSDRTRSNVFTLKMNDEVTSCTFSPDGELLYSHGMGGEVYVWDIKAQDCLHRFWDDGCVQGTAIGISRNNRYLATGSTSGIVNVYSRSDVLKDTKPTPQKIIGNLTTAISDVKFNPTSEILAMSSEVKENAIKLLHVPSMTVFQNFPPMKYNLRRPNCMDFSTNGGYFSVGNNRGAANLFRYVKFVKRYSWAIVLTIFCE